MTRPRFDVVIPTVGRPSLGVLLEALAAQASPVEGRILVVDDRRDADVPLDVTRSDVTGCDVAVVRGPAAGPAAARNVGWLSATEPWVAFLDDDVVPPRDWSRQLGRDLLELGADVAASQGRVRVPLPPDRRARDWERNVAGLERARWATADMAYRRDVLAEVGGFDERFPRAYREDADLGLRVTAGGYRIAEGERVVEHPVVPADRWVSVRLQRGNADDALMRAIHGPAWRAAAGVPAGRRPQHAAIVAAALRHRATALAGAGAWAAGTAELAWARIKPGPRDLHEVTTMLSTSVVLPWAAIAHWLRGTARALLPLEGSRHHLIRPLPPET
jgi:glycosyltransferase involved in cell wall biosynthesis